MGHEGDVDLARHHLLHGLGVVADVGAGDVLDAVVMDQAADALALDAGVVGDDVQVLDALLHQPVDERFGNAAVDEAGEQHGHAVEAFFHGLLKGHDFVLRQFGSFLSKCG